MDLAQKRWHRRKSWKDYWIHQEPSALNFTFTERPQQRGSKRRHKDYGIIYWSNERNGPHGKFCIECLCWIDRIAKLNEACNFNWIGSHYKQRLLHWGNIQGGSINCSIATKIKKTRVVQGSCLVLQKGSGQSPNRPTKSLSSCCLTKSIRIRLRRKNGAP